LASNGYNVIGGPALDNSDVTSLYNTDLYALFDSQVKTNNK
jgi:hypothetical protein